MKCLVGRMAREAFLIIRAKHGFLPVMSQRAAVAKRMTTGQQYGFALHSRDRGSHASRMSGKRYEYSARFLDAQTAALERKRTSLPSSSCRYPHRGAVESCATTQRTCAALQAASPKTERPSRGRVEPARIARQPADERQAGAAPHRRGPPACAMRASAWRGNRRHQQGSATFGLEAGLRGSPARPMAIESIAHQRGFRAALPCDLGTVCFPAVITTPRGMLAGTRARR